MTRHTIQNGALSLTVSSLGAQMKSLVCTEKGLELLWQADPAVWGATAPMQFPICGRLPEDAYTDGEKRYPLTIHGFAQHREWTLIAPETKRAVFSLASDEETRRLYPYDFVLTAAYGLGENRLEIRYSVQNTGHSPMPYALGHHPGYRWPQRDGESPSDYFLRFEQPERLISRHPNGCVQPFLQGGQVFPLSRGAFGGGALCLQDVRSSWVEFGGRSSPVRLRIHRKAFPFLVLWSMPDARAEFLCIEPTTSVSGAGPTLMHRQGTKLLAPGETDAYGYAVEVLSGDTVR